MLTLPGSLRVFVCLDATDMRRSFDGLAMVVERVFGESPLSGHLFVFRNRRGDRLKLLYWDRDGYAIWYKRLEAGVFGLPEASDTNRVELSPGDLSLILEGVDLRSVRRKKRFRLTNSRDEGNCG